MYRHPDEVTDNATKVEALSGLSSSGRPPKR